MDTYIDNELISIIVPVYNVEKYIDRCIRSIVTQTYSNLEILLVDDGTTDNSGYLCDVWEQKDNRIRVIHKENSGLSDARNVGIANSNGLYLAFVDSDDYIHPTMIERLYQASRENDAEISLCNWSRVDEQCQNIDDKDSPIKDELLSGKDLIAKLFESKYEYYVVVWNKLYRRCLFDDVKFIKGRTVEDEFIAHRLFGQCNTIVSIRDELYYYLQRSDSIMSSIRQNPTLDYYLNIMDFLLDRMLYLKSIGMNDYAAKVYSRMVFLYYRIFELDTDNTPLINDKIKEMKKEIRGNYGVSRCLGFKQRIHLLVICISPQLHKMYIAFRSKIARV